jgi:hypothetical protein
VYPAGSGIELPRKINWNFYQSGAHTCEMDSPQRQTLAILLGMIGGSAVAVAATLGYIAHYDFGLSRQEIRTPALVGAAIIAVLMADEFFGNRLRKRM